MFLSYFLYLNALFAQSLFVYDAVMLALLQIFKLPFGSQNSNCAKYSVKYMDCSVTTTSNSEVSPYSNYGQLILSSYLPTGAHPIGAFFIGASNAFGSISIRNDDEALYCYTPTGGTWTVRVLYI